MTIQEMIARQQAIVTQARNEGRGLSREEQTEFDQLQGKIDTLTAVFCLSNHFYISLEIQETLKA